MLSLRNFKTESYTRSLNVGGLIISRHLAVVHGRGNIYIISNFENRKFQYKIKIESKEFSKIFPSNYRINVKSFIISE